MKKIFNAMVAYFGLAMVAGVFYREFTKFNHFTGQATSGLVHGHLLMLGMVLFLIVLIINKTHRLDDNKYFKRFFILHNIFLPLMAIFMETRGIIQILGIELSKGMNAALAGMAGISHVGLLISLIMFVLMVKKALVD